MPTEFLMPKLGLTMEEGTITEWLVADGEAVSSGDAVLRIETDKTETDVEAAGAGRLHVVGRVGETYACGDRIGWFLADGESPPAAAPTASAPTAVASAPAGPTGASAAATAAATSATSSHAVAQVAATLPGGRLIASPNVRRLAADRGIDLRTIRGSGPGGRIVSEDLDGVTATPTSTPPTPSATAVSTAPLTASPSPAQRGAPATFAARALADLLGVDLTTVPADAVDGRVTKDAVAHHVRTIIAASSAAPPPVAAEPAPRATAPLPPALQEPSRIVPLTGMRGTIAKRMHASLAEMAQLTLHMDADLSAVMDDRRRRKADGGAAPGYTDYVIAASARALARHPGANAQVTDDGIALLPEVHVGIAVALDDGLIVPVVKDTLGRDLASLSAETSRLADAARSSSLSLPDLEGGTFSVSTLGMFGVDGFTPVINPPNAAILGVGRLRDELRLQDGDVVAVPTMTLSLTWDHRVFDGAPAAEFCRTIVQLLADPAALDRPEA